MPRLLKPQKVDHVVVGNGRIAIDIMLDRNNLDFFAKLGLDEVRATTAKECKDKARQLASAWRPTVWEGRIRVRMTQGNREWYINRFEAKSMQLELIFYRFERAQKLDGTWVERTHELDFEASIEDGDWHNKRKEHRDRGGDWTDHDIEPDEDERDFAYSAELWNGLVTIQAMIASAGERLQDLLARPDFDKQITVAQMTTLIKLLPAASAKKKKTKGKRHGS